MAVPILRCHLYIRILKNQNYGSKEYFEKVMQGYNLNRKGRRMI